MSTRDPRRDPRPGDVVEINGEEVRVHTVYLSGAVHLRHSNPVGESWKEALDDTIEPELWTIVARNATVLHAVSEPGSGARAGQDAPAGEGA